MCIRDRFNEIEIRQFQALVFRQYRHFAVVDAVGVDDYAALASLTEYFPQHDHGTEDVYKRQTPVSP